MGQCTWLIHSMQHAHSYITLSRTRQVGDAPAYKIGPKPESSSSGKPSNNGPKPAEPVDHFYYYPKLDAQVDEVDVLCACQEELLLRLPGCKGGH